MTFNENKRSLMTELQQLGVMEESLWKQKLRVMWIDEGDRNTFFSHKMASNRRWVNLIMPSTVVLSDNLLSKLKMIVNGAFESRFNQKTKYMLRVGKPSFQAWIG